MAKNARSTRVWDWPVRLSHWSFAVLVPAMWFTAEYSHWYWHTRLGTVLMGVLIFRLIWGFTGTRTARFSQFVRGPGAVLSYLRGNGIKPGAKIGHTPLGALSVVALLGAMLAQVGLGLFAGDPFDGATGPLNAFVGVITADTLTDWHEDFVCVVLGLAALHLAAIAFYAIVKRKNLVGPMITGNQDTPDGLAGIEPASWGRALIAIALSAGLAAWIWNGAPPFE